MPGPASRVTGPSPPTRATRVPRARYYWDTWGFDPARVRREAPPCHSSGIAYWLEDGFPLDAPGDDLLDALGLTLWARVEVPSSGQPRNRLVLRRGYDSGLPTPPGDDSSAKGVVEAAVDCVHLAVYAAPLGVLADLAPSDQAELARSTENNPQPVVLPPLEHFAALRSFAAGLADLGILAVLKMDGRALGFNELLIEQLDRGVGTLTRAAAADPHTPPGLLARLAEAQDEEVRAAVAGNLETPGTVLERLARDDHWRPRAAVLANPAWTARAQARLDGEACQVLRAWNTTRANASKSRPALVKPAAGLGSGGESASEDSNSVGAREVLPVDSDIREGREAAARNPATSPALLARLAGAAASFVREGVASNPRAPASSLTRLASDPDRNVRHAVARNPATSPMALACLASDTDYPVRWAVACNPRAIPDLLEHLAKDESGVVRSAVAGNPRAPPGLLARLTKDGSGPARAAAARNPRTPPALLERLAHDAHALVREMVAGNPRAPPEILARLAEHGEAKVRVAAAGNPQTPPATFARLAAHTTPGLGPIVRAAVAGNPRASSKLLARLAGDASGSVQAAVASNPATPAEILRQLVDAPRDWRALSAMFVRAGVAANPATPPALMEQLAADEEVPVRIAAAANPRAPLPLLARLARDANARVQRAVANNPRVTYAPGGDST